MTASTEKVWETVPMPKFVKQQIERQKSKKAEDKLTAAAAAANSNSSKKKKLKTK